MAIEGVILIVVLETFGLGAQLEKVRERPRINRAE